MQSSKIAPKKEVKETSNPEKVVFKNPSLDETSVNQAKPPSSNIKKNQNESVEVSKNMEGPAEDSKDLVKPKDIDVEIGEKPREVSKELKSESDQDAVSTEKANVKENDKEENIEVIKLMEEQPKMKAKNKIDSNDIKESKKTEKNAVQGSDEVEKSIELEQKPSEANESKNSKSTTTKIEIDASKTSKTKELTKGKQLKQKLKQFLFVKLKYVWSLLFLVTSLSLFIWMLSVLDPKLTRAGVGGTATHSFGGGSGSREEFGNHNKETGKKIHNMIVLTYSKVVLCT